MAHHTKKPRLRRRPKRGVYVSEARGRSSDGRWCPWEAWHSLSRDRETALAELDRDTENWQFRAVLYVPAKGRVMRYVPAPLGSAEPPREADPFVAILYQRIADLEWALAEARAREDA
jgi:hypothetical protein